MITSGNRAKETTTTSGTGTYLLDGPLAGFQSLVSAAGTTSGGGGPFKVRYTVSDDTDFEIGIGTLTAGGPDTLTRDSIEDSSAGGAAINWGVNSKNVFITHSAGQLAQLTDNDQGNGLLQRTGDDQYATLALPVPVASGGTGAATAGAARTNLGVDEATLEATFVKHSNESAGDEEVRDILSGSIDDIPANDAVDPGRLYVTTDADAPTAIYWDSGTDWVEIGVGAGVNPIVNGACQVAQQVANDIVDGSEVYAQVDMFLANAQGSGVSAGTAARAVNTNGLGSSEYVLKFDGVTTAGAENLIAIHRIESCNVRHLAGRKVSIGVVVRHDVGSNVDYKIEIHIPTVQDDFSSTASGPHSSLVSVASGTNTKLVFENVDLPATAIRGVEIRVEVALGSSVTTKNFEFTEFQLHYGPVCPAFNGSDYATEKLRCQRYYFSSFADGVEPQQNIGSVVGAHEITLHGGGFGGLNLRFPVEMFTTPTITRYSPTNASTDWAVPGTPAYRASGVGSSLNACGMAIVLSTHDSGDAEEVAFIHYTADARL